MNTYTILIKLDGSVELLDDKDEHVWSSDGDDKFMEEFDDITDIDELDDVAEWLEEHGYISGDDEILYNTEGETDND